MNSILKKSIIIGVAYFIILLANACCHCDQPLNYKAEFDQLGLHTVEYTFNSDTSFKIKESSADTIEYSKYGLSLDLGFKSVANVLHSGLGDFNQAYACKCAEDFYKTIDSIQKIEIRTLFDFDAMHSKGANVNEYFSYLQYQYSPTKIIKQPIEYSYNQQQYTTIRSLDVSIPFYLNRHPEIVGPMQFEIKITLSNGRQFLDTSKQVILK